MAHALINNTSRQRYHPNSVDQPEISAAIFRFIEFVQICRNCCTILKLARGVLSGVQRRRYSRVVVLTRVFRGLQAVVR